MRAFIRFNKGMMGLSTPVRLWLLSLVAVNLVIPLLFIGTREARVVIGTLLISMLLMTGLTAWAGFTRILGLGHILWVPLLLWLWTRLDAIPADDLFGIWIRVLMVLNGISLLIDAVDVTRYLNGEREEIVRGPDGATMPIDG